MHLSDVLIYNFQCLPPYRILVVKLASWYSITWFHTVILGKIIIKLRPKHLKFVSSFEKFWDSIRNYIYSCFVDIKQMFSWLFWELPLGLKSCNRLPIKAEKIPFYLMLKASKIFFGAFGAEQTPSTLYFRVYGVFMHYWSNCGPM